MRRSTKTRTMCLMALFSAITVIILYIASIVPRGSAAFGAIAGIAVVAAVIEGGIGGGISVYTVSGLLSVILAGDKVPAILYIIFFGYYPVVKSLVERIRKLPIEWILKVILVNIIITVIIFLLGNIITINFEYEFLNNNVIIYILGNIAFIIYDLALSKIAGIYMSRIYKKK